MPAGGDGSTQGLFWHALARNGNRTALRTRTEGSFFFALPACSGGDKGQWASWTILLNYWRREDYLEVYRQRPKVAQNILLQKANGGGGRRRVGRRAGALTGALIVARSE